MTRPAVCLNGEPHEDNVVCQVQQRLDAEPRLNLVECRICERLDVEQDEPLSDIWREVLDLIDETTDISDEQVEQRLADLKRRSGHDHVIVHTGQTPPAQGLQLVRCISCGRTAHLLDTQVSLHVPRGTDGVLEAVCRRCVEQATPDMGDDGSLTQPSRVRRPSRRARARHHRLSAVVAYLRGNGDVAAWSMMQHLDIRGYQLYAVLKRLEHIEVVASRRLLPGEAWSGTTPHVPHTVYRLVNR